MFFRSKNAAPKTPAPAAPKKPDTVQVSRAWNKDLAKVYSLRKGMWVYDNDHGVGIVTNAYDDGSVLVMLIDSDGNNKIALSRSPLGLRQAKLAEIPANRRPNASVAFNLGYV